MIGDPTITAQPKHPQDSLVATLRELGGLAHLRDIYSIYGRLAGREMDSIAEAKVRQSLQTFSSDASWERPKSAADLFYSLDGVEAATGIWGLRNFSPQAPSVYPRHDIHREYAVLLHRNQTTLFNMRGIAYKGGRVLGIHVNFGPNGEYPDRLNEDGTIDHIGEGKGGEQIDTGGNHGMLNALTEGYQIPVYQYVIRDRYAPLGDYVVKASRREVRQLTPGAPSQAYIFSLAPVDRSVADAGGVIDGEILAFSDEASVSPLIFEEEGGRALRTHFLRERNPNNRKAVIREKGVCCEGCDFVFGDRYGPELDGFIEVHHTRPLAAGPHTSSIEDFAVLCSNCHRAVHKGRGLSPRSVVELRDLLKTNR